MNSFNEEKFRELQARKNWRDSHNEKLRKLADDIDSMINYSTVDSASRGCHYVKRRKDETAVMYIHRVYVEACQESNQEGLMLTYISAEAYSMEMIFGKSTRQLMSEDELLGILSIVKDTSTAYYEIIKKDTSITGEGDGENDGIRIIINI